MTRITNVKGLPAPLVAAIANDDYSRGDSDISVSQLIAPPRKVALEAQHADQIEEDASERIWLLLGKSVHAILERAGDTGVRERRLFLDVDGWTVSGQFDHLSLFEEDGAAVLTDWKVTSAWSLYYGDRVEEWTAQLNLYAHLLRAHGYTVEALQVVAILRDWMEREVHRVNGYPRESVGVVPLHFWTAERAEAYLRERVRLHQEARLLLPQCTPEDRWANSRSSWTRCERWCSAAPFCDQYAAGRER